MNRLTLAALAALTLGTTFGAVTANAQYYDDRPRRYERYDDDYRYERRRRDWDEDRYERRRDFGRRGSICVTARGNCVTRPAPFNTPCGCEVPGFGFKRGAIGG